MRYLADINKQAQEHFELLVYQITKTQGVTKNLKAKNQMEWVQKMNNIRNKVNEIVNSKKIIVKVLGR